ncbi:MAG: beta-xylosidase, partial [Silvibacterium sp.]
MSMLKLPAFAVSIALIAASTSFASPGPPVVLKVVVNVDASKTEGAYAPVWNYFGADEANYVYARNGEKLLRELSALSPAPVYFRTHNLLTTGDGSSSLKWGSTNAYREAADGSP